MDLRVRFVEENEEQFGLGLVTLTFGSNRQKCLWVLGCEMMKFEKHSQNHHQKPKERVSISMVEISTTSEISTIEICDVQFFVADLRVRLLEENAEQFGLGLVTLTSVLGETVKVVCGSWGVR